MKGAVLHEGVEWGGDLFRNTNPTGIQTFMAGVRNPNFQRVLPIHQKRSISA